MLQVFAYLAMVQPVVEDWTHPDLSTSRQQSDPPKPTRSRNPEIGIMQEQGDLAETRWSLRFNVKLIYEKKQLLEALVCSILEKSISS